MASATIDGWRRSEKKLAEVTERLAELSDHMATLNDRYETLRARVGMRETRERKKESTDNLQGQAWKDEMRKKMNIAISPKRGEA